MSTPDAQPAVEIRHLVKSYHRGGQVVPVLTDITLDIQRGEFTALMGPSGSGKSTLLNLIAGIDKPDSGVLRVSGLDITGLNEGELADWRSRNVGFIFQFYNLMPVLSAYENVELPLTLTNLSRAERRERVELTLSMVGLSDRMHYLPSQLSVGQQQRVAVARALANKPRLLLADEPTANVDPANQKRIIDLIKEVCREESVAILLVTHSDEIASRFERVERLELINRAFADRTATSDL